MLKAFVATSSGDPAEPDGDLDEGEAREKVDFALIEARHDGKVMN